MFHIRSKFSDEEIYLGLQEDKNWAYKALMNGHTEALKNYVLKNGGSTDDSIEIEQRALIILYENIRARKFIIKDGVKISTYLFSIGQNQWLSELNRRQKNLSDIGLDLYTTDTDSEFEISSNELEKILIEELNNLGSDCYKLLKLKYYDLYNDKEVSQIMNNISVDNIRKRRYKCILKLKEKLTRRLKINNGDNFNFTV